METDLKSVAGPARRVWRQKTYPITGAIVQRKRNVHHLLRDQQLRRCEIDRPTTCTQLHDLVQQLGEPNKHKDPRPTVVHDHAVDVGGGHVAHGPDAHDDVDLVSGDNPHQDESDC
eukprot:3045461-Rhodomonas_salina.1